VGNRLAAANMQCLHQNIPHFTPGISKLEGFGDSALPKFFQFLELFVLPEERL